MDSFAAVVSRGSETVLVRELYGGWELTDGGLDLRVRLRHVGAQVGWLVEESDQM